MRQIDNNTTYYTVPTFKLRTYKSMLIHTFHQRSTHHSLPILSLPSTFRRFVITLQILSIHFTSVHFTYNCFPNPLFKNMWFTRESCYRPCRQLVPEFDCPIYKGIFPDIFSLFPNPYFPILIIPAKVA